MAAAVPHDLEPLRDALIDAHRRHATVAVAGLPVPRTDADAYAIQRAVAEAAGWFASSRPTAWKVGAASRDATPNAAPLRPGVVRPSPAKFAHGSFNRILIEGEVAFRLREPLAPEGPDIGPSHVAAAVGELVVTMEIVDPRYRDMDAAGPALRLADQSLNGALVVGNGIPYREPVAWSSLVATVRCNGIVVKETRGGHPLGNPLFLLAWLAGHAAGQGHALAAGDLVTAGTWTGVVEAMPGQTIDVEFPAIGRASARFE